MPPKQKRLQSLKFDNTFEKNLKFSKFCLHGVYANVEEIRLLL